MLIMPSPYRQPYLLCSLLSHMAGLFCSSESGHIIRVSFSSLVFSLLSSVLTGLPPGQQGAQRAGAEKEAGRILWFHRAVLSLQNRRAL